MKKILFPAGLILIGISLQAQTSHTVEVNNFSFNPAELTIEVGDTVIWTNIVGFHNVSTNPYPDNPESFENEASGSEWTFMHVFTLPGTNLYQCDVHPGPMQGTIIVEDPTLSVNAADKYTAINIFPNPATDVLKWTLNNFQLPEESHMTLFDLTGKKVVETKMNDNSFMNISNLSPGIYHYEIKAGVKQIQTGKLLVQTR